MTSTYKLTRATIDEPEELLISAAQFAELRKAKTGLFEVLSLEEKYDLIVQNFTEFEKTLHSLALSRLVDSDLSWSSFIEAIGILNRILANILSSCRMYVDHVPHQLNSLYGKKSEEAQRFKDATSAEYDSTFGYRVMYALRNYVQHNGLPVHKVSFGGGWEDPLNPKYCRNTADAYISVERLEQEPTFKTEILAELKSLGDTVDIKVLVRQNHSAFGRLHAYVRGLVKEDTARWDSVIYEALELFTERFDSAEGLNAVSICSKSGATEEVAIFDKMVKHRKLMQARLKPLTNMEHHYISSEISREGNA